MPSRTGTRALCRCGRGGVNGNKHDGRCSNRRRYGHDRSLSWAEQAGASSGCGYSFCTCTHCAVSHVLISILCLGHLHVFMTGLSAQLCFSFPLGISHQASLRWFSRVGKVVSSRTHERCRCCPQQHVCTTCCVMCMLTCTALLWQNEWRHGCWDNCLLASSPTSQRVVHACARVQAT